MYVKIFLNFIHCMQIYLFSLNLPKKKIYNLHNDTPNSQNVAISGVSEGGVFININSENVKN